MNEDQLMHLKTPSRRRSVREIENRTQDICPVSDIAFAKASAWQQRGIIASNFEAQMGQRHGHKDSDIG